MLVSKAKQSESQLKSGKVQDQASSATAAGDTWNMGIIQGLWPQCPDPVPFLYGGDSADNSLYVLRYSVFNSLLEN